MVIPHCQDRPFSCQECPGCSQSLWAFSCASCALFPVEMWVFGQGSWGAARDGMQAEFLQGGWCCLGNPGWLWGRIQGRVSAPLTFLRWEGADPKGSNSPGNFWHSFTLLWKWEWSPELHHWLRWGWWCQFQPLCCFRVTVCFQWFF